MDETKQQTYGEKAVGLSFNPGQSDQVSEMKKAYAHIIDILNDMKTSGPGEQNRLISISITEAQSAQMWAVKAITWKD